MRLREIIIRAEHKDKVPPWREGTVLREDAANASFVSHDRGDVLFVGRDTVREMQTEFVVRNVQHGCIRPPLAGLVLTQDCRVNIHR